MTLDCGDVVLRPFEFRDLGPLVAILGDADVMKLTLDERALTRAEAEAFIASHFAIRHGLGFGTVALTSRGDAIGFGGFRTCRYLGEADVEFGWVLGRDHHGRGYATAMGERFIVHALESCQRPRVLAACNPQNQASEHILRDKLRMRFEAQVEPRPGLRRRVYSASHALERSS